MVTFGSSRFLTFLKIFTLVCFRLVSRKWSRGLCVSRHVCCMLLKSYYTPRNEVRGGILDSPCLSVRLSVCLLTFRVRPVASTVQDRFFPYLVQMINSMRGCVACDDPWPWPISSRSFGLDLENRVRSVASTVLDGFFLYLAQVITIISGCVACNVFSESENLNFWLILKFFGLDLEKKIYSSW